MSLPLPSSLSPSKVSAFKDCALAFRFSAIDKLPEPPSPWAAKGTLVHKALELLFTDHPAGARDRDAAASCLEKAWGILAADPDIVGLGLDAEEVASFRADASELVDRYLRLEDPNTVHAEGTELMLEARLGGLTVRGIIDRLERDADGGLVVTDYKTGKVPPRSAEQSRLGGVHFYAWLCQEVLGERPARVQLLYLAEPVVISTEPTEQSVRGMKARAQAVWTAVERACQTEDFRPRPSGLCDWCAFRAYCPAFGGDPRAARAEAHASLALGLPTPARVAG
ncbi:MAG TPA: PD-(D/E)XK nuclease family protein [Acidimicrobiales bacterium]|nr:PD-(D/E)XK nuclease family protein [Acidimicrobiales bacterium]